MDDRKLREIAARVAGVKSRTAGEISFHKDTGPLRRDIRAPGFQWSSDAMRNLAKVLWAVQRAHSYSMAAYRVFSKMNSSKFSPDGLLGGRGYIQSIKDMRSGLASAAEEMSSFADTVQDELDADHWRATDGNVDSLVQDAEQVKANPDKFVEAEYDEVRPEDESEYANPNPDDYNPDFSVPETSLGEEEDEAEGGGGWQSQQAASKLLRDRPDYGEARPLVPKDPDEPGSQLPTDKTEQMQGRTEAEMTMNTTGPGHGSYSSAFRGLLRKTATSSIPVETLPGPRVDHIGPGEGNEAGHFNDEDVWPSDDPSGEGLSSGTNESKQLLEDWVMDGVTPYYNPTDGDSSVLVVSSRIARQCYSWLPGSRNEKNLDYYRLGLTEADVEWMRDHSDPDPPEGPLGEDADKEFRRSLWGEFDR